MASVILENIYKVYDGNVLAVDNVNLEIKDKEFMVLVGPSGCGKSTCLRMIAGLEVISKGTIKIGGKVVNDVLPKDRDISMVFQNYALYPHMTVYDNMAFGLKLRRVPYDEIKERVHSAAKILGLEDYLNRRPKQMSGGQRQRVAVGRAIVRNPSVFLFDEPLSNLDAKMRVQMRTEISRLHAKLQTTMIYVTHDQTEAMTMGTRICVMKDGIIQQVATPIELYDNPSNKFVASFIGTPPMNFFNGKIQRSDKDFYFITEGCNFKLPNHWSKAIEKYDKLDVVFGIRPEDINYCSTQMKTFKAEVDVIEPMGSETYLHLVLFNNRFIARVDAHCEVKTNDIVGLSLNLKKAHLFDKETEKCII